MIEDGGWVIVVAATVLALSVVLKMWRTAPEFVSLQLRLYGADMRLRTFLQQLNGDPDHTGRVNRVRKLDLRLPVIVGIALIGWTLFFAELPGHSQLLMGLGIASTVIAVAADYAENILLGRMVDALPKLPADPQVINISRITTLKCWAYIAAGVIVLLQLAVYLYLKAIPG